MLTTRRAFTLLELLLTMGVIALLLAIVLVALGGARGAANRAQTTNALRQMMIGYSSYYSDHAGTLMPGFVDPESDFLPDLNPRMDDDEFLFDIDAGVGDPYDASSYVWRLAPYVQHDWRLFYADYRAEDLESRLTEEFAFDIFGAGTADPGTNPSELGISLIPSFGLNSHYLGGDNYHGGYESLSPWGGNPALSIAATRYTEAKNPSRLIVFAPTRHFDGGASLIGTSPLLDFEYGYAELRAPAIAGEVQWHTFGDDGVVLDGNFSQMDSLGRVVGGGVPVARWGKAKIPVANLDGSVETLDLTELGFPNASPTPELMNRRMKRWDPKAIGFP